jgi:hypothetical protein
MALIILLTAATALAMLGFILSHPKTEEDWRDQAEGLAAKTGARWKRRSEPQGLASTRAGEGIASETKMAVRTARRLLDDRAQREPR